MSEDLRINNVRICGPTLEQVVGAIRDRTGLGAYDLRLPPPSGRDPGYVQWCVPIPGFQCLEVFGITDPSAAGALGRFATAGPRLFGWGLETTDLESVTRRLDLQVRGPSGYVDGYGDAWDFRWAMSPERWLPYFVEYARRPAEWRIDLAEHGVNPVAVSWIDVVGERSELREWLEGADLPIRFATDPDSDARMGGVTAVGIATDRTEIEIRPSAWAGSGA